MFLPTWIITNCIYHPEDLGAIKGICGAQSIYDTHNRSKRESLGDNEIGEGSTTFHGKMLLMKFKYAYAQKSGYEKCWICSKLHPGTARIPLMAVPLNITLFLNEPPPINLLNVSSLYENNPVTFPIVGRSHFPDWCFNLGNKTQTDPFACSRSIFNVSLCKQRGNSACSMLQISDPDLNKYFSNYSSLPRNVTNVLHQFIIAAQDKYTHKLIAEQPFAFGQSIYVCCGKVCYPWIPLHVPGWCYLASLVPIMGVMSNNKGVHPLEASMYPRYPLRYRMKRELFTKGDQAWAWFPSWTGWGIDMMRKINNYSRIIDDIMEKNSDDIDLLSIEQRALRKKVELHDLAIESMSAALTGLCEHTEDYECCTWIYNTSMEVPDYYDIIAQHRKEVNKLQEEARNIAQNWDPLKGLGGFGLGGIFSWLKDIAVTIVMILLFLLFLYACFKLIMCLITRATRTPDPAAANKAYLSMYYGHKKVYVTVEGSEPPNGSKRGL